MKTCTVSSASEDVDDTDEKLLERLPGCILDKTKNGDAGVVDEAFEAERRWAASVVVGGRWKKVEVGRTAADGCEMG